MLFLSEVDNGLRLEIKVQPRSAKNQIVGEYEGALKLKLTAPPVEGEANKALVNFLAGLLKIPKKNIILISGESSRKKVIEIKGIDAETLLQKTGLK